MRDLPLKEKLLLAFLIWLAVYPSVLGMNYLLRALDLDLPLPLTVLLTTVFTVPLLEFVLIPRIKDVVAKAEDAFGLGGDVKGRG